MGEATGELLLLCSGPARSKHVEHLLIVALLAFAQCEPLSRLLGFVLAIRFQVESADAILRTSSYLMMGSLHE